ncbi:MAG: hypothetical protein IPK27_09960 [Rhodanobacteraceae bacterium]|nr:hypothetical protein [Rhodanobacteraceae bacterium]
MIDKIESDYFNALVWMLIWTTPLIENVHGHVGENEWGKTYAYHGYRPRTGPVDPNLGDEALMAKMIAAAHGRPAGAEGCDSQPRRRADEDRPEVARRLVRPGPACTYTSLPRRPPASWSFTLQDIRTESEEPVELPDFPGRKVALRRPAGTGTG